MKWIGLAIGLALLFSLAELLTKYENKVLRHILNRYFLVYLIVHGTLAYVLYLFLPKIGSTIVSPELANTISHDCWQRSVIAGLGYPVILRSKFFNIGIEGKEVPFGIEAIYLPIIKYLIDNTTRMVKSIERDIVMRMIKRYKQISTFQGALKRIIAQEKDENIKKDLKDKMEAVAKNPDESDDDKLFSLGIIILDKVGSEEEMNKLLGDGQGEAGE